MRIAIATVLLTVAPLVNQVTYAVTTRQEITFCENGAPQDLVLKPTSLPSAVLKAVMNTAEGKAARKIAESDGKTLDPGTLLKGTRVRLTEGDDLFYVVIGSFPMSGADNTWFWLIRQSGSGATVLLFAGANCLTVRQTRTLGYRDIETNWSSASTTTTNSFRYNGRSYELRRSRSQPNRW